MNRKHRHYSEIEKQELLDRIESSGGTIRETLARLGISKSTYYGWKSAAEISKGLRLPSENSARNFYLVSQALEHQKTINKILSLAPCTAQARIFSTFSFKPLGDSHFASTFSETENRRRALCYETASELFEIGLQGRLMQQKL